MISVTNRRLSSGSADTTAVIAVATRTANRMGYSWGKGREGDGVGSWFVKANCKRAVKDSL